MTDDGHDELTHAESTPVSRVEEYKIWNSGSVFSTILLIYARWTDDDFEITQIDIYPDYACEMKPLVDGLTLEDFPAPARRHIKYLVSIADQWRRAARTRAILDGATP